MYYSPSGAAARALLNAVFTSSPSYAALLTMAIYTVMFGFISDSLFPLGVVHWHAQGISRTRARSSLQPFPCRVLWRKAINY
jgi:hypothetical protein